LQIATVKRTCEVRVWKQPKSGASVASLSFHIFLPTLIGPLFCSLPVTCLTPQSNFTVAIYWALFKVHI